MGAQPPFAQLPDYSFIKTLMKEAPIKIMTFAPEIKGGLELIDFLIKNDIKPQIGHSLADYNCCILAIEKGVKSFTHLYNAMSGFQHRNPGVVAAAFSKAKYAEIICDLIHVNKEMIKLAFKNIDRLYSITDSISASGMPDGKYKVGTYEVYKKNRVVKLNEDTLGGSIVTMDKAFNNLIKIGFSIQEAVKMTSTNAARYLDRKDIGHISKEAKANLLVLDSKLNLIEIYLNGNLIS
jgi:N-acetylglucosamine-6-phosphate deacetylase